MNEDEPTCLFCGQRRGEHAVGCRLGSTCEHDWVPEPLVVLMERCTRCPARRPIESRERRATRLLTEAAAGLNPEPLAAPPRPGLYRELLHLSHEMAQRADLLEARRHDAHETLNQLVIEDQP